MKTRHFAAKGTGQFMIDQREIYDSMGSVLGFSSRHHSRTSGYPNLNLIEGNVRMVKLAMTEDPPHQFEV